jgi:ThiF family
VTTPWKVVFDPDTFEALHQHLFPGDGDEHGAVLGAVVQETPRACRLLVRRLWLAEDGVEYVPGEYGYGMLTPSFVRDRILDCDEQALAYLAVHCHGGTTEVGFSREDMRSHERGYPALRALNAGRPVGALVFAREAVAGDLWLPDGSRAVLDEAVVAGRPIRRLRPAPAPAPARAGEAYERQSRLFGDRGQNLLAAQKVAVMGAGGAGSLLVEYLARLGVGHLVVIDPDHLSVSNLPRVVGSRRWDAWPLLTADSRPRWMRRMGVRLAASKVRIARRVAKHANPHITFTGIRDDVVNEDVAAELLDCDHLFLAADTMQARLLFNAVVHQYLIPGSQVGAKVTTSKSTGEVLDVFSVYRTVLPGRGCLWCNELINPAKLQEEAQDAEQVARQRYVDDPTVVAPSVITLNAVAAAHAADDYLFSVTGLLEPGAPTEFLRLLPRSGGFVMDRARRDRDCPECSGEGRLAAGPSRRLPTRLRRAAHAPSA